MSLDCPHPVLQLRRQLHLPNHLPPAHLRLRWQLLLPELLPPRHQLRLHQSQMRIDLYSQHLLLPQPELPQSYDHHHLECPGGYWGSDQGWLCVSTCPVNTYYANSTIPLCVSSCPDNYYGSPTDRVCYQGGHCPLTPVTYYSDDTTKLCVAQCPLQYYADNVTARCLIYCSPGWFAE